jgi:hypothetical protein
MQQNNSKKVDNEVAETLKTTAVWSSEQERFLELLVATHGTHNWPIISEAFHNPTLNPEECRAHWNDIQDLDLMRTSWTKEEEALLLLFHMRYQNRWREIAETLRGRPSKAIKNRFYTIFRRAQTKLKTRDYAFKSMLDVAEVYYSLDLMEFHLKHPLQEGSLKRKRGIDYLHTLVKGLSLTDISVYRQSLISRWPLKAPLKQVLQDCVSAGQEVPFTSSVPEPVSVESPYPTPALIPHTTMPPPPMWLSTRELPKPGSSGSKDGLTQEERNIVIADLISRQEAIKEKYRVRGLPAYYDYYYKPAWLTRRQSSTANVFPNCTSLTWYHTQMDPAATHNSILSANRLCETVVRPGL